MFTKPTGGKKYAAAAGALSSNSATTFLVVMYVFRNPAIGRAGSKSQSLDPGRNIQRPSQNEDSSGLFACTYDVAL